MSKKFHPDKNGENSAKQTKLNEAYEVIQAYLKVRHSVVPIELNLEHITRMEKYLIKSEIKQEVSNISTKIYRKKKNKINTLRYISWTLVAVTGILTFFSKDILPTVEFSQLFQSFVKIYLIFFGGTSLLLQLLLQKVKLKLEVYVDLISDKKECAIELAEILSFKSVERFSKEELLKNWDKTRSSIISAFYIGKYDLIDITLTKSKEHNLISLIDKDLTSIDSFEEYKTNFDPAIFDEKADEKVEKPKTIDDVKFSMVSSLFGTVIFILGGVLLYIS